MNGFTVPDVAGEALDYEGMCWSCEEDYSLLMVSFIQSVFL